VLKTRNSTIGKDPSRTSHRGLAF